MLYYNYTGMKKETQEQGAKVVEKYRKQFAHNMEMYNYTAKGKNQMIADLVKAMDYELIYRGNKLSIKRSPYKKNIRIERYFGNEYSIDRIKQRIERRIWKRL